MVVEIPFGWEDLFLLKIFPKGLQQQLGRTQTITTEFALQKKGTLTIFFLRC